MAILNPLVEGKRKLSDISARLLSEYVRILSGDTLTSFNELRRVAGWSQAMKAVEVMRLYQEGRRDFKGVSLRDQNFKGKDLSGADFSGADIRGANFSGAQLHQANFSYAKAGLVPHWKIGLTALAYIFAYGSGKVLGLFCFVVVGTIISLLSLIRNLELSFVGFLILVTFIACFSGRKEFLSVIKRLKSLFKVGIQYLSLVILSPMLLAGSTGGLIGMFLVWTKTLSSSFTFLNYTQGAGFLLILIGTISFQSGMRSVNSENDFDPGNWVLRIASWRGTSFSRSELVEADFNYTDLRFTNLSYATLSRASFYESSGLNLAYFKDVKLTNMRVRQLMLKRASPGVYKARQQIKSYRAGLGDFSGLNLSKLDLKNSDLAGINLTSSSLEKSNLESSNLRDADLEKAQLSGADLRYANLRDSNISGGTLIGADLRDTEVDGLNLSDANLQGANFSDLNLRFTIFSKSTKFQQVNLSGANLSGLCINGMNLQGADLRDANLSQIQALGTNFSNALLTGACIEDWNINKDTVLDDVICDYVYLKTSKRERRPSSQNFKPGEFAALFQQAVDTVDLIFKDGIDWQAFFQSFQELRSQYIDDNLSIRAIERKQGGAFVIRVEVSEGADKSAIESSAKELYEIQLKTLEAQYEKQLRLQGEQHSEEIQRLITAERQEKATLMGVLTTMASQQGPKYDLRGAQIAGGVAETVQGTQYGGTMNNSNTEPSSLSSLPSLTEATTEIQKLLTPLEASNPKATQSDQIAFLNLMIPPTRRERFISALQSTGSDDSADTTNTALEDIPYGALLKALVKSWQSPGSEE
ncbi:pentapeptide repeat-containing protein [Leptothoe sp. EHU-05/26/07-4]